MTVPSDLDTRIAAICTEYELTIAAQARRAGTLAAELASTQAQLKTEQLAHETAKAEIAAMKAAPPAGP